MNFIVLCKRIMEQENKRTKRIDEMMALLPTLPHDIWKYMLSSYSDLSIDDIEAVCVALGAEDTICGGKNNVWDMIFKRQYGESEHVSILNLLRRTSMTSAILFAYRFTKGHGLTVGEQEYWFKARTTDTEITMTTRDFTRTLTLDFAGGDDNDIANTIVHSIAPENPFGTRQILRHNPSFKPGFRVREMSASAETPYAVTYKFPYAKTQEEFKKQAFIVALMISINALRDHRFMAIKDVANFKIGQPNVFCGQCFERAVTHVCVSCVNAKYCGERCARSAWDGHHQYGCK